jgi:hypothetical protein
MLRGVGRRSVVVGVAVGVAAVLAVAGCSSSGGSDQAAPRPPSARQFCNARARREVSTSLGVPMLRTPEAHADAHRYECTYEFERGRIGMSVTKFANEREARARHTAIARERGRRPEPPMLGEELEAFVTTDGSMVVRKDRDVLEVDVAGLPEPFGRPPQARSVIALAVAVTTIGHWVPG